MIEGTHITQNNPRINTSHTGKNTGSRNDNSFIDMIQTTLHIKHTH